VLLHEASIIVTKETAEMKMIEFFIAKLSFTALGIQSQNDAATALIAAAARRRTSKDDMFSRLSRQKSYDFRADFLRSCDNVFMKRFENTGQTHCHPSRRTRILRGI
jgi:hypothetical protein